MTTFLWWVIGLIIPAALVLKNMIPNVFSWVGDLIASILTGWIYSLFRPENIFAVWATVSTWAMSAYNWLAPDSMKSTLSGAGSLSTSYGLQAIGNLALWVLDQISYVSVVIQAVLLYFAVILPACFIVRVCNTIYTHVWGSN